MQQTDIPIHFFTIVLNGNPFISYHIEVFKQLPFKWHWHIIEGVADLKHDTAWSLKQGGHITNRFHLHGRSTDGTTEYLDLLAQTYHENITIYRKPDNCFWDGKLEMVNAPLTNIQEECLLWQVDVDEMWTLEQICTARKIFINEPDKTAAFYWCWYFVGEKLVISTRYCYTQNPEHEWLRTWRFKPGFSWNQHEPPILVEVLPDGQSRDVAKVNPFLHEYTEKKGLIFQHFAYVTLAQLEFKEEYYGYKNAIVQWLKLQEDAKSSVLLGQYFSWVKDDTMVDTIASCGVVPIVQREVSSSEWRFLEPEEWQKEVVHLKKPFPQILIDGIFFQFYNSGIARVWRSLLKEWANNGFAEHIVMLDRAGTCPKIPGIRYHSIPPYKYSDTGADSQMLQRVCDEKEADLFISTYYTAPTSTPSVFMAYDMIPEVLNVNLNEPSWIEKHYGILHAFAYITISVNTACDLKNFFPHIYQDSITVAYCGVEEIFSAASLDEVDQFKANYNISKPYFLLAGDRTGCDGYKNGIHFFRAFSNFPEKENFAIVCVGGRPEIEPELAALVEGTPIYMLRLSDLELRSAYSGATALVYPSLYEGFGLPIAEAMACACPVITCRNSSIREVAGEAALYVDEYNVDELERALHKVQEPEMRQTLIHRGLEQAKKFSWTKMAETVASVLVETSTTKNDSLKSARIWDKFRQMQYQLQQTQIQIQIQLQQSQSQANHQHVEMQQMQVELERSQEIISAIQSSKFWKLRSAWFRLKQALGVPTKEQIL